MAKNKIRVADIIRKEPHPKAPAKKSAAAELREAHKEAIKKALPEVTKTELKKIKEKVEVFERAEIQRFKQEDSVKRKKRFSWKTYLLSFLLLIVLGAGVYAAIRFLPKVNIKITAKKTEWTYVDAMTASKNAAALDVAAKLIPAEIFSQRKNFNFSFLATGKRPVKEKAKGLITIYNAYSSDPKKLVGLVSTTRFEAPDGKIFRLDKNITLPVAKIVDGKIVPSTIEVTVSADKVGPDYNIGPVSRFTLPGLKDNPEKFKSIYAESKDSMVGCFIGDQAYPTESDIKKGRAEATQGLKDTIDSFLSLQIPPAFKIIDGSKQFKVIKEPVIGSKEQVNIAVDDKGNFSFYMEAESVAIAFRESDVLDLMRNLAKSRLGETFDLKDYKIDYGPGRPDFVNGKISFAVNFTGRFWQPINVDDFRQKVKGKKEQDLRNLIFSLAGVEKATISFWPFWVKSAPDDLGRVTVEVE